MVKEAAIVAQRLQEANVSGTINLKDCGMMSIPMALFFCVNNVDVKSIDVSMNQLKSLPARLLQAYPDIITFDCSSNLIDTFPVFEACKLVKLQQVNLSSNKLSELPKGVPLTVELLDVSNNLIVSLSDEEIEFCKQISGKIIFSQNPLDNETKTKLSDLKLANIVF